MGARQAGGQGGWPAWARGLASLALLVHLTAAVAVNLAAAPSSPVERALAELFGWYYQLTDQGHAHRYYSEIPPTPIAIARLRFDDGRPEQLIRIPDRVVRPRLRYQRQLALAHHLYVEFERNRDAPIQARQDRWARSYARHLCRLTPHCSGVVLLVHLHLLPDPDRLRAQPGAVAAEEEFTVPERIGDYSCRDL